MLTDAAAAVDVLNMRSIDVLRLMQLRSMHRRLMQLVVAAVELRSGANAARGKCS